MYVYVFLCVYVNVFVHVVNMVFLFTSGPEWSNHDLRIPRSPAFRTAHQVVGGKRPTGSATGERKRVTESTPEI